MRYNNYHRHDHYSNIRTPDVIVKPMDYIKRAKELGHTTYFTTNHGCSGNVLEAYQLCLDNNLKCIYGMEMYYTDDRHIKEGRNNHHIVVIGLTKNAYYEINRISSEANKTGFYYHPRVDLELLLSLPKDEVIITTACIAGRLFKTKDYIDRFLLPLKNHFGNNFMLEVQSHIHYAQANWNEKVLEISKQYNIPIIHGNDSHYIYPQDAELRSLFLKGKGMRYGDEDSFILDYPDYDTIIDRYEEQGILSRKEAETAIKNTLIFDKAEDLGFKKDIKMPDIHGDKDKNIELKKILAEKWNEEKKSINKNKHQLYAREIHNEMTTIEDTDMADYFLLNEKIINRAVDVYNAVLTKSGRGSAPSYYINKLLGFTDIDRIDAPVPLYSSRFMSTSRILETGSLPDIDFNFASIEPVVKASKDVLGEDGVYYMVAYGTLQESAAFRNLCRAYKDDMEYSKQMDESNKPLKNKHNKDIDNKIEQFNREYNEVAKGLDNYKNDPEWKDIIELSKKFIGVIDSIAPSPCSFLLLDKPISKEIGLIRVGNEICATIDGLTADRWKYLKNDYLTVSVWSIISKTFNLIDKPIPSIKDLEGLLDDKVWDLYNNGITATMNQVDSDFATSLVSKYKPQSVAELSAFVAAIRPGFASLLDHFINRREYTTGVDKLDELLSDSFAYMLYQESIMKFLAWCGIPEDETYSVLKMIAKKTFNEDKIAKLKEDVAKGYEEQTGDLEGFENAWRVIDDAVDYSFNASHSVSVAYDSLYGGYLKANYPLEYYTVVLNHYRGDLDRTNKIMNELPYFNIKLESIKFGYSGADYRFDKETNSIYKGIASIKYLNEQVGNDLQRLGKDNKYNTFYDVMVDLTTKMSIDSRQLRILTTLNFFDRFGNNQKLLKYQEIFSELYGKKQLNKAKCDKLGLPEDLLKKYSRETPKTYIDFQYEGVLRNLWHDIEDTKLPLREQIEAEKEYLSYIEFIEPRAGDNFYIITEFKTYKNKNRPYITLYRLNNGETIKTKVVDGKFYALNPFKMYNLIRVDKFKTQKKNRLIDGKWQKIDETEDVLDNWQVF